MKSVFVMLITFFLFDIIWIKAVAVGLYERHVPDLLLRNQSAELASKYDCWFVVLCDCNRLSLFSRG